MKTKLFFLCLLLHASGANAAEISDKQAVKCILGEARSEYSQEGFKAFLAIAEAMRNRGTIRGVYGCGVDFGQEWQYIKAKKLDSEAARAWRESKYSNITNGADHWESIDFKAPYWVRSMKKTVLIGKHQFYKE